eukprot:366444-Chlamydomonas_euryale.AAC.32
MPLREVGRALCPRGRVQEIMAGLRARHVGARGADREWWAAEAAPPTAVPALRQRTTRPPRATISLGQNPCPCKTHKRPIRPKTLHLSDPRVS